MTSRRWTFDWRDECGNLVQITGNKNINGERMFVVQYRDTTKRTLGRDQLRKCYRMERV